MVFYENEMRATYQTGNGYQPKAKDSHISKDVMISFFPVSDKFWKSLLSFPWWWTQRPTFLTERRRFTGTTFAFFCHTQERERTFSKVGTRSSFFYWLTWYGTQLVVIVLEWWSWLIGYIFNFIRRLWFFVLERVVPVAISSSLKTILN